MDGDFRIDIDEIIRNIDSAEVISIYFPILRKAILIDTRFTEEDHPMVKIVSMASTVDERYRSLKRLRPSFPRPSAITVVPWYKYVESLLQLGIWRKVLERFVYSGHKDAVQACERAFEEISVLEIEEISSAITGENYRTMWTRSR